MRRMFAWILVAFAIFIVGANVAWDEDTCASTYVQGDWDMWNTFGYLRQEWYRDEVANFYNLKKGDWDEGWGWVKYNDPDGYLYPLSKMMYAARILWAGLDDTLSVQDAWSAHSMMEGPSFSGGQGAQLHAIARTSDIVELFFRDPNNCLRHVALTGSDWYAGQLPSIQIGINVSDQVATDKRKFHISGEPSVICKSGETIDVFALSGNELIHFFWSTTAGWRAESPTESAVRPQPFAGMDRFFIYSNPIAISRTPDTFDIFACDNFRHLIHYFWSAGSGWRAEDLTLIFGDGFNVHYDPVVVSRSDASLDVFGIPINGNLLHFRWSPNDGWQARNITQGLGTRFRVIGAPAAVSRTANGVDIFAQSYSGSNLLHFWSESGLWAAENLTERLNYWYPVEGDPAVLSRTAESLDVFARDLNDHLIHFYWQPSAGWNSEDLSRNMGGAGIVGKIATFSKDSERIDIFGRSWGSHLLHYYWYHPLGWQYENATTDAINTSASLYAIVGDPAVVSRNESALDVFSLMGLSLTAHYVAAIGLCVNPWHSNTEYSDWASGTIHDFKYVPGNFNDQEHGAANAQRGWFVTDRVQMCCPSFNESTGVRASNMIHEATHMNYWDNYSTHQPSPTGWAGGADGWIFHTIGDPQSRLDDGIIATDWNVGYVIVYDHSPYQAGIEYLSDIGEFPRWDVPFSVYLDAIDTALFYMYNAITNPPGWVPGIPRPLH